MYLRHLQTESCPRIQKYFNIFGTCPRFSIVPRLWENYYDRSGGGNLVWPLVPKLGYSLFSGYWFWVFWVYGFEGFQFFGFILLGLRSCRDGAFGSSGEDSGDVPASWFTSSPIHCASLLAIAAPCSSITFEFGSLVVFLSCQSFWIWIRLCSFDAQSLCFFLVLRFFSCCFFSRRSDIIRSLIDFSDFPDFFGRSFTNERIWSSAILERHKYWTMPSGPSEGNTLMILILTRRRDPLGQRLESKVVPCHFHHNRWPPAFCSGSRLWFRANGVPIDLPMHYWPGDLTWQGWFSINGPVGRLCSVSAFWSPDRLSFWRPDSHPSAHRSNIEISECVGQDSPSSCDLTKKAAFSIWSCEQPAPKHNNKANTGGGRDKCRPAGSTRKTIFSLLREDLRIELNIGEAKQNLKSCSSMQEVPGTNWHWTENRQQRASKIEYETMIAWNL